MRVLILLAMLIVTGCGLGNRKDSSDDDPSSSYRYQFTVNGCDTGNHEFSDKDSYCHGLLDERLNRACARQARWELYQARCRSSGSTSGSGRSGGDDREPGGTTGGGTTGGGTTGGGDGSGSRGGGSGSR